MQTPTQAADLQAAVKKALHSAFFSKYITSAVQLAMADQQASPQDVVLPAGEGHCQPTFHFVNGYRTIESISPSGRHVLRMQCPYQPKGADDLGIWYGSETRTDKDGRTWSTHIGDHVVDNFGTLVPVAGVQA